MNLVSYTQSSSVCFGLWGEAFFVLRIKRSSQIESPGRRLISPYGAMYCTLQMIAPYGLDVVAGVAEISRQRARQQIIGKADIVGNRWVAATGETIEIIVT